MVLLFYSAIMHAVLFGVPKVVCEESRVFCLVFHLLTYLLSWLNADIPRLPFWPYMKLTVVCWLMIPKFDGAFYVYNHFVHPCLYIDAQTIINWFKKQQEFVFKDNFLSDVDKYVKAHGPEALEKLIASKVTEPSMLQKDIKPVQVTEKREVAPVNPISEIEPNAAETVNNMNTLPDIEGSIGSHPQIPSDKQVQKEWTCAMCQITTTCEKNLNTHFQGRRHRDACEKLMKEKNQPSKGKVSFVPVDRTKHSGLSQKEPQKHACSTSTQESQKEQQQSVAKNYDLSSKALNPEIGTSKSNLPKEKANKSLPNYMAGNQIKPSEKIQGQQQVPKKHAEIKISEFRCTICNISCTRSGDLNCHLWGKKHLARIQELNSAGRGQLA
ncbi:hypothetical protein PTKIN_Ptkin02bG0159200 [Pterospermum kingtungense]